MKRSGASWVSCLLSGRGGYSEEPQTTRFFVKVSSPPPRIWRTPEGTPVACIEKLKVLEQNLTEFEAVALDLLEDAALMGCDVEQVRAVLAERLAAVKVRYGS